MPLRDIITVQHRIATCDCFKMPCCPPEFAALKPIGLYFSLFPPSIAYYIFLPLASRKLLRGGLVLPCLTGYGADAC